MIQLPRLGELDAAGLSFPLPTVPVGLADGFNPCAMYVLVVLLGILLHARSRGRVALYGGIFVAASGMVYFGFMTAWLGLSAVAGVGRGVTLVLGGVLVPMGLVNLKDLLWFKRGPSLIIPEAAKPGISSTCARSPKRRASRWRRRGLRRSPCWSTWSNSAARSGSPRSTRDPLAARGDGALGRAGWLALYNLAYVVPLGAIVLVAVVTMRKLTLGERGARALKAISGTLLLLFGLLFLLAPDALR